MKTALGRSLHDFIASLVQNSTSRTLFILSWPVRPLQLQRTPKRKRLRLAQKPKSLIKRPQYFFIVTRFSADLVSLADEKNTNFTTDDYNDFSSTNDLVKTQQVN